MLKGLGGRGGREEGVEGRKERQLEVKIFQVLKQPHEIKPSDYSVKEISIQKDGETESKSKQMPHEATKEVINSLM